MATLTTPSGRTTLPARPWRTSTGPTKATGTPVKILRWLAVALIAVGVVGRLVRYFLAFPVWGDEAFVCFNLLHRDFAGLTRGLEYAQVAPILFLWGERAVVGLLGYSEHAMRLLPLLAGLASLALFWRLARSTVPPLSAAIAVGLLAVARWPVSMDTFVKPYSGDLLMALMLLVPAVEWMRRPEQLRWPALLALAAPVALAASYPAVFVAGAVSLALLPTAWRSGWAGRGLFVAYNLLVAATFLGTYWLAVRTQLNAGPGHGAVDQYLQTYWADSFPPASPLPLLKWLALAHTGQMMAYPVGGSDGLSSVTFLLFVFGAWTWWKGGRRSLLVLWLAPFALNLLAAALHRYPYGGGCRLCQHLAPAVCLLAGTGIAALLERFIRSDALRMRWAVGLSVLLGACAVGGIICDVVYPYRDPETRWLADMPGKVLASMRPGDPLVVVGDAPPTFRWYLELRDRDVRWNGPIDWDHLAADRKTLTTANVWVHRSCETVVPPTFEAPAAHGWTAAERTPYTTRGGNGEWTFHVEVCRWAPPK